MAASRQEPSATAAELLSRFFDDVHSAGQEVRDKVAAQCPAEDGITAASSQAAPRGHPDKAGLLPELVGGQPLRPGVLCRPGAQVSPLWEKHAITETPGVCLGSGLGVTAGGDWPAAPIAAEDDEDPLGAILQDVELWLQAAAAPVAASASSDPAGGGRAPPAGFSNAPGKQGSNSKDHGNIYQRDAYNRQIQDEVAAGDRKRPEVPGDEDDGAQGQVVAKSSKRKSWVLGGPLLVQEMKPLLTHIHGMSYLTAWQFSVFHSWQSMFGIVGPDAEEGEDPRVRGLISNTTPAIMLCELNALASFNMMDPILSYNYEFLMDAARLLHKRTPHGSGMPGRTPLGYMVQGAGPHFCPGGNHHPVSPPGGTPCTMHINTSSNPFIYNRECNLPSVTVFTGSVIGGGVALGLQQTQRLAASSASMAFGNISRGACPVMFLSQNLPTTCGFPGAVDIYLSDGTYSACKGQRAGLVWQVMPSFAAVKTKGMQLTKKLASAPFSRLVNQYRPLMTYSQYQREAMGMTLAMRTGRLFANVKSARWTATPEQLALKQKPAREEANPSQQDGVEYGGAHYCNLGAPRGNSIELAKKEDKLPPDQGGWGVDGQWYSSSDWEKWQTDHVPGSQEPCAGCNTTSSRGDWGIDGLWYCGRCWEQTPMAW